MPEEGFQPFFAFVWRPQDISRSVVEMARTTSTRAIFDIPVVNIEQIAKDLKSSRAREIKISTEQLINPALDKFLDRAGIETLWVEYHPGVSAFSLDDFFERFLELSGKYNCLPVASDPDLLVRLAQLDQPPSAIALKGTEASGFVSSETTGVLFSTLKELQNSNGRKPGLIIWGGIFTPEAAAAFLCSGSVGIVFESFHWLTDMVSVGEDLRQRLAKLRPEHTTLTGLGLNLPVRIFDKGNSKAVKELISHSGTLLNGKVTDRKRHSFARYFTETAVHALSSGLRNNELIPLGPEAAFAKSFTERFGRSTEKAISSFIREVSRVCFEAEMLKNRFLDSKMAEKMSTAYPIIQGAMSWISDVPEFSLAVAEAGGLPTIALGLKSREQIEEDLGRIEDVMDGRPYAVNLITLSENPYIDQQLAWVEENRPPFVVIAAGDLSRVARLLEKGIDVIYVAPDQGLLRIAFEAGVRFVVLEGNEAGGHVGELSTLILSQIALELKRKDPELFNGKHIVLAGGIFNHETAFRAAMLGADGIQMGTAYLATQEIVSTGALKPIYQHMILESNPGTTVVSGESAGLRVRSLKTPKMEAIGALERKFAVGEEDERSFRRRLEELSAGSLLIAARGVEKPEGPFLDEKTCLEEGQFMSGAVAGNIIKAYTVAELHHNLMEGPFEPVVPSLEITPTIESPHLSLSRNDRERIAITGMAVVNSLGNSPEDVWAAVLALKSGVTEAPSSRLSLEQFYDPDPRAQGKSYCKVGAFYDLPISRKELGIPPHDFRTMAESTKLTLWLAHRTVNDSGILDSDIPRERIGVLISQNSGEVASTIKDLGIQVNIYDIIESVKNIIRIGPGMESKLEQQLKAGRITVDDTTLLGRLNCAAGGFICNKYGFMGPSHSVSAACATSLVALYNAVQMIKNGVIDAALIGGGEELLGPAHYLEFSAIGALAGISGVERPPFEYSRPFDSGRDGMVLGEGGGMIVIERESVAKKRGAPILAFITGVGASNNDQGLVEPSAESQGIAIRNSFKDASYGPDHVDLVECHATSTLQGDLEEVRALKDLFPHGKQTIISSLKSQIGHTLGAAGIIGLIRGVKAMQAGIYPPTLNYQEPDPAIGLESWGFHVHTRPDDWPQPSDRPRRLMVNAFGFGGTNYVVQIEQSRDGIGTAFVDASDIQAVKTGTEKIHEYPSEIPGISFFNTQINNEPYRIGVVADDEYRAMEKISVLDPVTRPGPLSNKYLRVLARHGVFIAPVSETPPPMAFAFSGQGTYYSGMGKRLYDNFDEIRQRIDLMAETAEFDLLELLFTAPDEKLKNTRWQQPALFTMEYAIARCLMSHGVMPTALVGHSLGQNTALCLAEVISPEDGFRLINKRAECMEKASDISEDPGAMIAVDAPLEVLEKKIAGREKAYFTNFNSPHQIVLGGDTEEILVLLEDMREEGYRVTRLNVSMAFHSPIMRVIHEELEEFVSDMEFHSPRIPVISNTTMKPFPEEPAKIKKIFMSHLERPVHWMQNVKTLWNDFGVRLFVEVGPKDTLSNLIADTLNEPKCILTCKPEEETRTFRAAGARLFALGHLKPIAQPSHVDFPGSVPPSKTGNVPSVPIGDHVSAIVHREIHAFIMETFGNFLKPQILSAVRREADPSFSEAQLETLLRAALTGTGELQEGVREQFSASAVSTRPSIPAHQERPAVSTEHDLLEAIIQIIMDATGYERDEIEPDMDIRQDLAIRSSRLPVIMDAAERQFGITINLEEFIDVRTIRDIADRIARVEGRPDAAPPMERPEIGKPLAPSTEVSEEPASAERKPLKRLVFHEAPLGDATPSRLEIEADPEVALFKLGPGSELSVAVADLLKRDLVARPLPMEVLGHAEDSVGYDLSRPEGAEAAARHLAEAQSLAGLIMILDHESNTALGSIREIPALLTGFFRSFQNLMRSPAKAFCLVLQQGLTANCPATVFAEGVHGMFLAASQEYPSVLFRSVALDIDTDLSTALSRALDTDLGPVQLVYRGQEALTIEAKVQPAPMSDEPALKLGPEDVVVISGGARGITGRLARALAPFRPRLVLLGRSELEAEVTTLSSDSEITRTLKDLFDLGVEAAYYSCDVRDHERVAEILGQVVKRYGRIDGIIHGAGILRDSFMEFMSAADFEEVISVKLLGAWNLHQAAMEHGLRFIAGLSSIAAALGNPGQANYCAANRSMSALVRGLADSRAGFTGKAMMLAPIEGTGMADDPEVKELMKLRGMESAYIHVSELAELFCRELFVAPAHQSWVMLARDLPHVNAVQLDMKDPVPEASGLIAGGVAFRHNDLPMIQTINRLDLKRGELEANRVFSLEHDLWIDDHRPFKFMKYPLISGIMAVETFLEAAYLLYPHLKVLGMRQVEYRDILGCPPSLEREARIMCRQLEVKRAEVICQVSLSSADISPSGRPLDRWSTNYQGQVVLGSQEKPSTNWPDFPVNPDELDTRPISHDEVLEWYESRSNMQGRYRVVDVLDGTGPGVICGCMVYQQGEDFAGLGRVKYQYSPYLLEALMHMLYFYVVMRDEEEARNMIPSGFEEMHFTRRCRPGERVIIEARLRSQDSKALIWDARAVDDKGATIMQVAGVRMNWFKE